MTDEVYEKLLQTDPEGGSSSVWRQSKEYLLPATFEERGAAIPFTTPALTNARIRLDWRKRLELMVNNFTDSAGQYIIPWDSIPEVVALTAHDRILHKEIKDRKAMDPFTVRRAVLDIAKTGLAGPQAEVSARRSLKVDDEYEAQHQVFLLLQIIRSVEKSAADELIRQVVTQEGQERIRNKLAALGGSLGVTEQDFDAQLLELGLGTAPLGVRWNPAPGRLRIILARLIEFRQSVLDWAQERLGDVTDQAAFCATVSQHTIKIANSAIQSFDLAMEDPLAALKQADNIFGIAARLGWLLDGWELIIEMWMDNSTSRPRAAVLLDIVSILPVLPRKETDDNHDFIAMADYNMSGKRWVKLNTDWRTGEYDEELVRRFEALKAGLL